MDFAWSQEQEILKKTARDFFAEQAPTTMIREMKNQKQRPPYPADLWQKMADLGWMGIALPEQYGGAGGSLMDMMSLIEEMGRACIPGPLFTSLIGGLVINAMGNDKQKADLLPKIAAGDAIASLALVEPTMSYEPGCINLTATANGSGYTLNGTKLFVLDVESASTLICVARTGDAGQGADGLTAFLVDVASAKNSGLSFARLDPVPLEEQYEVVFNNVAVGADAVLGEVGKAWGPLNKVLQIGAVAKSIDMVGASQRMLELAVDHAKERVQFGRPIGSFQAVQHHCANIVTDLDTSRFLSYQAAWMLSEGLGATKQVSLAKSLTSDAHRRISMLAHQVVGGVGLIIEHDMHMYTERGMGSELHFGSSSFHRDLVAQELGL